MNCMNCGAVLTDLDLDYCPSCGSNVLIQKKVDYLSKYYYNQGLEKASIRDLSGAISCLKQSLAYNKRNIQARNLLGLVYFETGEVVAALSEWVISKNLQPSRNLASEYINRLQANSNKLEAINETIKKYNHALQLCREGHEDMAAIQLRKILAQNSKLIKGYHLLALIQIKEHEWSKVRKTLRKAIRIDKTNTTTLRFLKEVDERTGVATKLDRHGLFRASGSEESGSGTDYVVNPPVYKERKRITIFFTLMMGIGVGMASFWLLVMPAIRQRIYREANDQIVRYSESLSSQGAQLSRAQGEARESGDTVEAAVLQIEEEKLRSSSYEALLEAYSAMQQEDYDEAALAIQKVRSYLLSDSVKWMYTSVCNTTGVKGIENPQEAESGSGDETPEDADDGSGGSDEDYDDGSGSYGDGSYNSYDDGSYDGYDDGSGNYDDGSYDSYDDGSGSYDDGSYDSYDDGSGSYDDGSYDSYDDGTGGYDDGSSYDDGSYDDGSYDSYDDSYDDGTYDDGSYDDYDEEYDIY